VVGKLPGVEDEVEHSKLLQGEEEEADHERKTRKEEV
jgi:hypothetical protein